MMHRTRHHGIAAIMALIFLVFCAALTVMLYTMLASSIGVTRNSDQRRRASWAAESGLDYLMQVLATTSSTARVEATDKSSAGPLLDAFRGVLQTDNPLSGAPQIRGTNGTIEIPAIALESDSSFTATIEPKAGVKLSDPGPHIRITVVGSCGLGADKVTRRIGMDIDAASMAQNAKQYGMVSKRGIYLPPSANGGVFLYDGTDITSRNEDSRTGSVVTVDGGYVLKFPNEPTPTVATFPTYSPDLYTKLRSYNWAAFDSRATTFTNVKVPAGTNWTITQNTVINGILYVEYGASITMGSNSAKSQTVTINGAIVWQPKPDRAATVTQTLELGRYVAVATPTSTRDSALQAVLGADDPFNKLLHGNVVVAPQTDLVITSGNDEVGIKVFNGGLHINNMTGSGSGNVLNKVPKTGGMLINNGGITAEGTIDLGGNNAFTILPPQNNNAMIDENRYRLAFEGATYWEDHQPQ